MRALNLERLSALSFSSSDHRNPRLTNPTPQDPDKYVYNQHRTGHTSRHTMSIEQGNKAGTFDTLSHCILYAGVMCAPFLVRNAYIVGLSGIP
jgi:hypothetical protein